MKQRDPFEVAGAIAGVLIPLILAFCVVYIIAAIIHSVDR